MGKRFYILLSVLFILILIFVFKNFAVLFVYYNPYTYTDGFKYIAKPIKIVQNAINYTQDSLKKQGVDIDILYENTYGSGYLNNNPIPNDVDYSVGIDLGEYDYNEGVEVISRKLAKKIVAITPTFINYINNLSDSELVSKYSYFDILNNQDEEKIYNCIARYLDKALSGENYIKILNKVIIEDNVPNKVIIPYPIDSHQILLDNYEPITLFGENIIYSKNMKNFLREFMITFEFSFNIKKGKDIIHIELVPEYFVGSKLSMERRIFASNAFLGLKSHNYIKKKQIYNNDKIYLKNRMLNYKTHLGSLEYSNAVRPIKLSKRLMQTADIISPLLDPVKYNEIGNYALKTLSNPKNIALNDISVIMTNVLKVYNSGNMYKKYARTNKLQRLYSEYNKILVNMQGLGFDKDFIKDLNNYGENYIKRICFLEDLDGDAYKNDNLNLKTKIDELIYENTVNKDELEGYIKLFNDIYYNAGYYKVLAFWLDEYTLGIIRDDFTSKINDFEGFIKINNLPCRKIVLITEDDVECNNLQYSMWVRFKPDSSEEKFYENIKAKFIADKKNFKPKFRLVFTF